jgi:hypothetical protein
VTRKGAGGPKNRGLQTENEIEIKKTFKKEEASPMNLGKETCVWKK